MHEFGGSMDLGNVGILPQNYTASQPRTGVELEYLIEKSCLCASLISQTHKL